jgi:hypothetical protein
MSVISFIVILLRVFEERRRELSIKRAYCVIPGYEKLQIKKPRYKDKGEKAVPGSTLPS